MRLHERWLDQLGALAKRGTAVQCRQTLAGADYGLLDEETLEPTPDYWASLLWRRCMGTAVHDTMVMAATADGVPLFRGGGGTTEADTAALRMVRIYCHRGAAAAAVAPAVSGKEGQDGMDRAAVVFSFLAINLGAEDVALDLRVSGYEASDESTDAAAVWVLNAPSLSSSVVSINGVEAATLPDGTAPEFPPARLSADGYATVPAGAAAFVRLPVYKQE